MEKVSLMTYVLSFIAFYLISGAVVSALDRRVGARLFKELNRWTGDPDATKDYGFIYNRNQGVKWFWAFVIATITDVYLIITSGKSVVVEVLTIFIETPLVYIGFMAGPWINKFLNKRKQAVEAVEDVVEKVQSGEMKDEFMNGASEVGNDLKKAGTAAVEVVKGRVEDLNPFGNSDEETESEEDIEPVTETTSDDEESSKSKDPYAGRKPLDDYK